MSNSLKRRTRQLLRKIPDVLNYDSLLYIGANRKRMQFVELFDGAGYEITIIEIWKENVEYLKAHSPLPPWNKRPLSVIQGDVRDLQVSQVKFDIVMWWHGPEHVSYHDRPMALRGLVDLTRRFTIIGCPPGEYPQGKARGNPHEKHHEPVDEGFFHDPDLVQSGWETEIDSNNLLAWRKK